MKRKSRPPGGDSFESERGPRRWLPLEELPLIAHQIESYARAFPAQKEMFAGARYRLDQATVERALRVYEDALESFQLFEDQLTRWNGEQPSSGELGAILHLEQKVVEMRRETRALLQTIQELRGYTIESLLEKDDLELGLEALAGMAGAPAPSPQPPFEIDPESKTLLLDEAFAIEVGEEIREAMAGQLPAKEAASLVHPGLFARALAGEAGPLFNAFLEGARASAERLNRKRGPGLVCARIGESQVDLWWFPRARLRAALFGADAVTRSQVASELEAARSGDAVVVLCTLETIHPWRVPREGLVRSLGKRPVEGGPFRMPEGIEVIPEPVGADGNVSVMMHHQELGELGRIQLLQQSRGRTRIQAVVTPTPANSRAQRQTLLENLAKDLEERLTSAFAPEA